ncbi:hypothetical protein V1514DRAFT_351192 [Lipomyces japonicus]|uniref:uncharacterized protein n=1 Tax=Lipomyces japonicus TaxID=56871 RepID=UPI0034CD0903
MSENLVLNGVNNGGAETGLDQEISQVEALQQPAKQVDSGLATGKDDQVSTVTSSPRRVSPSTSRDNHLSRPKWNNSNLTKPTLASQRKVSSTTEHQLPPESRPTRTNLASKSSSVYSRLSAPTAASRAHAKVSASEPDKSRAKPHRPSSTVSSSAVPLHARPKTSSRSGGANEAVENIASKQEIAALIPSKLEPVKTEPPIPSGSQSHKRTTSVSSLKKVFESTGSQTENNILFSVPNKVNLISESEHEELQKKYEASVSEIARLNHKLKSQTASNEEYKSEIANLLNKLSDSDKSAVINDLQSQLAEYSAKVNVLSREIDGNSSVIRSLEAEIRDMEIEKQQEIDSLKSRFEGRADADELQAEIQNLMSLVADGEDRQRSLIESHKSSLDDKNLEIEKLQNEFKNVNIILKEEISSLKSKLSVKEEQLTQANNLIQQLHGHIQDVQNTAELLKQEKALLENTSNKALLDLEKDVDSLSADLQSSESALIE